MLGDTKETTTTQCDKDNLRVCPSRCAHKNDYLSICSLALCLIAQNTGDVFLNSFIFLVVKIMIMGVPSEKAITKVDLQVMDF